MAPVAIFMPGMHAGFRASGTDTRMELSNCSTSSDLRGCEASSKGVMHAVDVVATNATQEGFAVFSQAEMIGCRAIGSGLQVPCTHCNLKLQ